MVAKRVCYLLSMPISDNGFNDSLALESLMSAKHEQVRSQNVNKGKIGKKEKKKTKRNEEKRAREKNQLLKVVFKGIMRLFFRCLLDANPCASLNSRGTYPLR